MCQSTISTSDSSWDQMSRLATLCPQGESFRGPFFVRTMLVKIPLTKLLVFLKHVDSQLCFHFGFLCREYAPYILVFWIASCNILGVGAIIRASHGLDLLTLTKSSLENDGGLGFCTLIIPLSECCVELRTEENVGPPGFVASVVARSLCNRRLLQNAHPYISRMPPRGI